MPNNIQPTQELGTKLLYIHRQYGAEQNRTANIIENQELNILYCVVKILIEKWLQIRL